MCDNYEQKLSAEIITGNYHRKLSASIYHHAKNVGIIGILAYPKRLPKKFSKMLRGKEIVLVIKCYFSCGFSSIPAL